MRDHKCGLFSELMRRVGEEICLIGYTFNGSMFSEMCLMGYRRMAACSVKYASLVVP